jgi:hypothetical protein
MKGAKIPPPSGRCIVCGGKGVLRNGRLCRCNAIADRSAIAPRRETGVARKGESGGAGTAIAQQQPQAPSPHPISRTT